MEDMVTKDVFWKDRRVFITGHTGFKGSWLVSFLKLLGADVCGFSLQPPTTPNLFNVANVAEDIVSIEGDIRQADVLLSAVDNFQPEIVFHLAAQAIVRESFSDPVTTYETNIMGVVNLLEAARNVESIRAVIIVTSDKCYENREWVWGYRENEAMGGFDPYSSSKGCAELVTSSYQRSFFNSNNGLSLSSVRAGNVIGGGDWAADRLIPDLCRAFSERQAAQIRNPDAVRPWQHVMEPLSGYLLLAKKSILNPQQFIDGWNFGADYQDAKPVAWIADKLVELWGEEAKWFTDYANHPHEAYILRLDCSKARSLLNWYPRLNLAQSLELTVDWYKAFADNANMQQFTEQQIQTFINMETI